jgi:hypothetical protein
VGVEAAQADEEHLAPCARWAGVAGVDHARHDLQLLRECWLDAVLPVSGFG